MLLFEENYHQKLLADFGSKKSHKACCVEEINHIFEYYGKIFSLCPISDW
jgi:hypothetical protein